MRMFLTVIAMLMVVTGLLWIGQGTGVIRWPASSMMINERPWAIRGAGLVLVGIALFLFTRRRR